ncbi:MAG: NAD(P)-dependent oxidoreductase [Planctomycetes bacterium]|nr:NAD(P)-dependent oxidoreductase [Planctomycetota bacterium]
MNAALMHERIGILYPGEMGSAIGRLLQRSGHRVVTTLEGRGRSTEQNCRAAELQELPTLQEVVRTAAMLLVLVPPRAAASVAAQVRERLGTCQRERLVYVDLNSVSPEAVTAIAAGFAGTAVEFVDGAILGLASQIGQRGVLYLSGTCAEQVAQLFHEVMPVQVLGSKPGQASMMRMLLSGMTKGVMALFVEMALAGHRAGILEQLLAAYQANYPGIMDMVQRILPTYPRHAVRRGQEVAEVENTLCQLDLCPTVMPGVRQLIAAMGQCGWTAETSDSHRGRSVPEIVIDLDARQLLRRVAEADGPRFTTP